VRKRKSLIKLGIGISSVMIVLFFLGPYYWQIISSFKPGNELFRMPPTYFPKQFTSQWYRLIFIKRHFLRNIFNSAVIAGFTTLICLICGSLTAYAVSRLRFRFKYVILGLILAFNLLPGVSIVGPLFLLLRKIGLIDTHSGLVIPYISFSLPLTVWLLTSYFNQLPSELEDAARMDGCTPFQAYLRIILPCALPGFFAVLIIVFISAWNELFFALIYTNSQAARTVTVATILLQGSYEIPWGPISAASIAMSLPIVLIVILAQKGIVEGLTRGAVK